MVGRYESNKQFLDSHKSVLKKVILPSLDDQTLLSFGSTCALAPNLVDDFITYRGIVLRDELTIPPDQEPPVITLLDSEGESLTLSMKSSLQSGLLCAKRCRNLKSSFKDTSLTYQIDFPSTILQKVIDFCDVASKNDANETAIWAVENLDDASAYGFVETIKAAEKLKINSLLLRSVPFMVERMRGLTVNRMVSLFDFEDYKKDTGFAYDGDYVADEWNEKSFHDTLKSMKHFMELLIPMLDDATYNCFASLSMPCAKLVNNIQSRTCFLPGNHKYIKISIRCSDQMVCLAPACLVRHSGLVKNVLLDHPYGRTVRITLKSISIRMLWIIIKSCDATRPEASRSLFNSEFKLLDLAKALHTLKIPRLLDLVTEKIVSLIHHKQVADIRLTLGVQLDFKGDEDNWWGYKHGSLASCRSELRRSMRQILPAWENLAYENYCSDGPEPAAYYNFPKSEEAPSSDDSETSSSDSEPESDGSDGSEGDEEEKEYAVAVDEDVQ